MKTRKTASPAGWGILIIALICLLPAATAWGQDTIPHTSTYVREDFSDDELKSFLKANEKVMAIQMEGEQKMIKAIQDEGLTLDRFNQILEEQRDTSKEAHISAEELQSFNNAAQVILEENAQIEQQAAKTIQQEGIEIETYKQIMNAYQQNPGIQNRINEMVQGEN